MDGGAPFGPGWGQLRYCLELGLFLGFILLVRVAPSAVAAERAGELFEVGISAYKEGLLDLAERQLEACLQSTPPVDLAAEASFVLATIAYGKREFAKAATGFQRTHELAPDERHESLYWAGKSLALAGHAKEAAASLAAFRRQVGPAAVGGVRLAEEMLLLLRLGDCDAVVELATSAEKHGAETAARRANAACLEQLGRLHDASLAYESLSRTPGMARADRGEVLSAAARCARAAAEPARSGRLFQSVGTDTELPLLVRLNALDAAARDYEAAKNSTDALASLQTAIALARTDTNLGATWLPGLLYRRSAVALEHGSSAEAVEATRELLQWLTASPRGTRASGDEVSKLRALLADLLEASGAPQEAITVLTAGGLDGAAAAEAQVQAGLIACRAALWDVAAEQFAGALASGQLAAGSRATALEWRGRALERTSRCKEAAALWASLEKIGAELFFMTMACFDKGDGGAAGLQWLAAAGDRVSGVPEWERAAWHVRLLRRGDDTAKTLSASREWLATLGKAAPPAVREEIAVDFGLSLMQSGHVDEAEQVLRPITASASAHAARAALGLSAIAATQGDTKVALALLDSVSRRGELSEELRTRIDGMRKELQALAAATPTH
ncbi:MAG: hypothetical protein HYV63_04295 [Candidatus Schekmanbacteria bacterium]|nr:hypothetical protein [Candidatus Schekmanbacteria bacterium]